MASLAELLKRPNKLSVNYNQPVTQMPPTEVQQQYQRPTIDPELETAYQEDIAPKKGFMAKYGLTPSVLTNIAGGITALSGGDPYMAGGLAQAGQQLATQETAAEQERKGRLGQYVRDIKERQSAYDIAQQRAQAANQIQRLASIEKQKEQEAKDIGGVSKEQFLREKQLRGEYIKNLGTFPDIVESYGRIQASIEDPSAAGDLSLIFNFMKMLDPNSVVRESEFANAQNAAGIPERIRAQYNKVLQGERLSKKTRADFSGRSDKLYKSAENIAQNMTDIYKERAGLYDLDPKRTLVDFRYKKSGKNKFGSVQEAEKANLPKGTVIYINGKKAVVE